MKQLRDDLVMTLLLGIILCVGGGCLSPIPPGPGPGPRPGPSPIKVDKLVVVIIEESADRGRLPREQFRILSSTALRGQVKQFGGEFRLLDDDSDTSRAPQWIKDSMAAPRSSLPWLIVASKKGGVSLPLPDTIEKVEELIRKYGG